MLCRFGPAVLLQIAFVINIAALLLRMEFLFFIFSKACIDGLWTSTVLLLLCCVIAYPGSKLVVVLSYQKDVARTAVLLVVTCCSSSSQLTGDVSLYACMHVHSKSGHSLMHITATNIGARKSSGFPQFIGGPCQECTPNQVCGSCDAVICGLGSLAWMDIIITLCFAHPSCANNSWLQKIGCKLATSLMAVFGRSSSPFLHE